MAGRRPSRRGGPCSRAHGRATTKSSGSSHERHSLAFVGRAGYRICLPIADSASSVPSSAVVIAQIERRIHLDQIERRQLARLGHHLHHHVRLAVVEAAFDRRADAGRDRGIAHVHVERHVNAAGAVAGERKRALHHLR